jgi:hypothetical protein
VTVYKDRTFDMVYKTPPASVLLKKYANVVKGSGTPNKEKVGTVTRKHLEEIAKIKIKDMNAGTMERRSRRSRAPRGTWASRSKARAMRKRSKRYKADAAKVDARRSTRRRRR